MCHCTLGHYCTVDIGHYNGIYHGYMIQMMSYRCNTVGVACYNQPDSNWSSSPIHGLSPSSISSSRSYPDPTSSSSFSFSFGSPIRRRQDRHFVSWTPTAGPSSPTWTTTACCDDGDLATLPSAPTNTGRRRSSRSANRFRVALSSSRPDEPCGRSRPWWRSRRTNISCLRRR